jgi:hypothetical protein
MTRKFAAECDRLAKIVPNERYLSVLKEMADAWRELAAWAAETGKNA